jgi:Tol biopolymer transport system component
MTTPRTWGLLATTAVVSIVLVVWPGAARPAYPGLNGKIAFWSERDDPFGAVYTMNADGSAVTRLAVGGLTIESPAWSPDGTKIAFASKHDYDDVYIMDVASGDLTRLTFGFDGDFEPTWSPDASKIAFVSDRDGNNEIYVMNADGSDQRRLTDNPGDDGGPAWSPDGDRIAFYSSRDGFFKEIYLMDAADGGNVTPLVPRGFITGDPSWSPDGGKVAFRKGNEIFTVDLASGVQINLTNNSASDGGPAWSPDGTRIAFVSFRDGNAELYVMDADGSNQTRLTNNGATDLEPDWQPLPQPPPPGACITLSDTSLNVSGTASTPSTRRVYGTNPDRLTITNCGSAPVHLAARGTDASGAAAGWQLVEGVGSTCDQGLNVFRASFGLLLSEGGVGIGLTTRDRLLAGADGTTPFTLDPAAAQESFTNVEMPCVGSLGLGDPMTMDITLTAVAP